MCIYKTSTKYRHEVLLVGSKSSCAFMMSVAAARYTVSYKFHCIFVLLLLRDTFYTVLSPESAVKRTISFEPSSEPFGPDVCVCPYV
jgi:hypothetical protein